MGENKESGKLLGSVMVVMVVVQMQSNYFTKNSTVWRRF